LDFAPTAPIHFRLTRNHTQARKTLAMNHVNWTREDLTLVLFTDESRFCLDVTDRGRMWRKYIERFHLQNVAQHNRYGGGSIMV